MDTLTSASVWQQKKNILLTLLFSIKLLLMNTSGKIPWKDRMNLYFKWSWKIHVAASYKVLAEVLTGDRTMGNKKNVT